MVFKCLVGLLIAASAHAAEFQGKWETDILLSEWGFVVHELTFSGANTTFTSRFPEVAVPDWYRSKKEDRTGPFKGPYTILAQDPSKVMFVKGTCKARTGSLECKWVESSGEGRLPDERIKTQTYKIIKHTADELTLSVEGEIYEFRRPKRGKAKQTQ